MKLVVDQSSRFANARAHTATHLLHSQLQKIFPDTKQAGSWVGDDELRFDFSSHRALSNQEIRDIETTINDIIYQGLDVTVQEMSYQEAIETGAKAFFEDKYGDKVRVVSVGKKAPNSDLKSTESFGKEVFSIELCGGTHVSNTREIGSFVILGQEAVASGIKRISAFVGPKVVKYVHSKNLILDQIVNELGVRSHTQIEDKVMKLIKDGEDSQEKITSLEDKLLFVFLKGITTNVEDKFSYNFDLVFNVDKDKMLSSFDFKSIISQSKKIFSDKVCLFVKDNGSYSIISNVSGTSARDIMQELGRKGGGNNESAQGRM